MVRSGACLIAIVMTLTVVALAVGGAGPTDAVARAAAPVTTTDETVAPPNTVTEFYPESANLSDCVGLVEKPGCGSDSRGGWRQTAVFVVLFAGLGVVLWRVSLGIRANRAALDPDES